MSKDISELIEELKGRSGPVVIIPVDSRDASGLNPALESTHEFINELWSRGKSFIIIPDGNSYSK